MSIIMDPPCQLDHIVMAARNIEEGVDYFRHISGIALPKGGFHPMMGTHNHLMQIGNQAFFEIIAIDPKADHPQRPRWYGLDDGTLQLALETPRLITWVVNTGNLNHTLKKATYQTGPGVEVTRGDLNWLLTIPEDGGMPNNGLLPSIIQWGDQGNPCLSMPDLDCHLQKLAVYHPYPTWYRSKLNSINAQHIVEIYPLDKNVPGYFTIMLQTPGGTITLNSQL